MTRPRKPSRFTVVPHPDAVADVIALAAHGLDVVAAAMDIAEDLAHGRVVGKALGECRVSGDLTGLARVKFDAPGYHRSGFDSSAASSTTSPARSSLLAHETNTRSTASHYSDSTGSASRSQFPKAHTFCKLVTKR